MTLRYRVSWRFTISDATTLRGPAVKTEHKQFDTRDGARRFFERVIREEKTEAAELRELIGA